MRILTTAAPIAFAAAFAAGGAFAQSTTEPSQTRDGDQVTTSSPSADSTAATGTVVVAPTAEGETEAGRQREGEAADAAGTTAVDRAATDAEGETDASEARDGEQPNTSEAADDSAKIEVGMLSCDLTQSSNNIVLSSSEYLCELEASDGYNSATYVASIDKVGIDLSSTDTETLKWAVLTSSEQFETAMIEGAYVGASADAALGAGGGVRALVGGDGESVSLQPLSVSGSTGIGASIGLERMELRRIN